MPNKKIAVLLLEKDGVIVQRLPINRRRTTIGRKTDNDLVIDSAGVSGLHAVINRTPDQFFYEDLNSTNGSRINGDRVDYGMLYAGDVIEFGAYTITFVMQDRLQIDKADEVAPLNQASVFDPRQAPPPLSGVAPDAKPTALIRVVTGPAAGKEWVLNKSLTTIGYPPHHIAAFLVLPDAYAIAHVEGSAVTTVNGGQINKQQILAHGDVIRMGDGEAIFFLDLWYTQRLKSHN